MKKLIKVTSALAGITAAAAYGVFTLFDEVLFNRSLTPPEGVGQKISGCDNSHLGEFLQNNLKWIEEYGYERHFMYSDRGERLTGYLMKAEKESDIYLFGVHGYRSTGKREFSKFVQYYLNKGINVFLVDHIASGESEGNFCTFGYYEKEDCMKWLSYMTENFGKDIRIILHGVSMGSATVCMMSGREDLPENVKMIVADCGFNRATDFFRFKGKDMGVKKPDGAVKFLDFVNKTNRGFSFEDIRPFDEVKKAKVPMLFAHGKEDKLVPVYMCCELYSVCGSEYKDIVLVDGADHAQAFIKGAEEYQAKLDKMMKEAL